MKLHTISEPDIQIIPSQVAFSRGMYETPETAASWDSLPHRILEKLRLLKEGRAENEEA